MPVYTYHCENCDHEFDERQSFSEENLKDCPNCNKKEVLYKIYKPAQIVFKGSGYYVTDNKSKKSTMNKSSKTEEKKSGEGPAKEKSSKSDTPAKNEKPSGTEKSAPAKKSDKKEVKKKE